jgi:hypothetical protein
VDKCVQMGGIWGGGQKSKRPVTKQVVAGGA